MCELYKNYPLAQPSSQSNALFDKFLKITFVKSIFMYFLAQISHIKIFALLFFFFFADPNSQSISHVLSLIPSISGFSKI